MDESVESQADLPPANAPWWPESLKGLQLKVVTPDHFDPTSITIEVVPGPAAEKMTGKERERFMASFPGES